MATRRIMPVGEQSFENLRNDKAIYVDKTKYIYRIITSGRVFFLSRPRRFGKSLLLSTLEAYFLGKKELFKGLFLEQAELELAAEEGREAWIEYPVLNFSLSAERFVDENSLESLLNRQLAQYEKLYGREPEDDTLSARFIGLLRRACQQTGRQVVFLMDEYDKPLLETLQDKELHQTYREILHAFYSVIKESAQYLRFVFLTGVTRFSKVGIFSGLNNLNDISMDTDMAGLCGITEGELEINFKPEIEELTHNLQCTYTETLATLKQRYDGYHFTEDCEMAVYNPFSLLNVFQKKKLNNYWFTTGTPTFLVEKLKEHRQILPNFTEGFTIPRYVLENYSTDSQEIVPVLFQAGYLTIKDYIPAGEVYRLGFPNDEVKYSFLGNLQPILAPLKSSTSGAAVWEFQEAIVKGDIAKVMAKIEVLLAGVPYDNINDVEYRERDAQVALFFIFTLLGQFIQTEVHNNKGRADIVVHTADIIYIFELKLWSAGTAEDAIAQIEAQGYATPYQVSGKKILLIGASFDQEKRNIGEWVLR
ncbi:MAG: ATP-binding protein [Bacteroides sp.]